MTLKEDMVDYDPSTGRMRSTPRQVFLELSSRCNLTCVHCSKDFGRDFGHPKVDLPMSTIRRLEPWLTAADFVNLNGVGESLMLPEFEDALEIAARGHAKISFNTNGINLTDRLCAKIVAHQVYSVVISIDGMESNQPIRGVPYSTIRQRVLALDRAKKASGSAYPRIGIAYTLMRRNLHELPRLLADLLPIAKIDTVHVQPLIVFYETLRDENIYLQCEVDEVVARCRELADKNHCLLTLFRSTFGEDERKHGVESSEVQLGQVSDKLGCIDPFYEIKIRSTGEVMSCSMGLMGGLNVNSGDLDSVWNHDWYLALRRRLYSKQFEGTCHACPYVFGSVDSQVAPLRAGAFHSQDERFRQGGYGKRTPAAKPTTNISFLGESRRKYVARGIYNVPLGRIAALGLSEKQLAVVEAVLERLDSCPIPFGRLLEGRGPIAIDIRERMTELPYYELIHEGARKLRNHEWNALTRRVLRDTVPFWVDRRAYEADLWATGRATQAEAERILAGPVLEWLRGTVHSHGGRVLVLGCGFGALSLDLARRGLQVHGVDDNPEAIDFARAMAADYPDLKLTYEAQDFDTLTLEPESADVICAWQSLHHLEHSHRIVRQARRALRPGGLLVLQDFMAQGEGEHALLRRFCDAKFLRWLARGSKVARMFGVRKSRGRPNGNHVPDAVVHRRTLIDRFPLTPEDLNPAPITPVERVTGAELLESIRSLFPGAQVTFERAFLDYGHTYRFVDELLRHEIPARHARFILRRLLNLDTFLARRKKYPPREFRVVAHKKETELASVDAVSKAKREVQLLFPHGRAHKTLSILVEEYLDVHPNCSDPVREVMHALWEAVEPFELKEDDPISDFNTAIGASFARRYLSNGLHLGQRDRWSVIGGFHNAAPAEGCRWFNGDGLVLIYLPKDTKMLHVVCRRGFRRDEQEEGIPVEMIIDGQSVGSQILKFDPADVEETRLLAYKVPDKPRGLVRIGIRARSFVPHDEIGNGDLRRLSFRIERIEPK